MVARKRDGSSLGDDLGELFLSLLEKAAGSRNVTALSDKPVLHDRANSEADLLLSIIGSANCSLKIPPRRDLSPANLISGLGSYLFGFCCSEFCNGPLPKFIW